MIKKMRLDLHIIHLALIIIGYTLQIIIEGVHGALISIILNFLGLAHTITVLLQEENK